MSCTSRRHISWEISLSIGEIILKRSNWYQRCQEDPRCSGHSIQKDDGIPCLALALEKFQSTPNRPLPILGHRRLGCKKNGHKSPTQHVQVLTVLLTHLSAFHLATGCSAFVEGWARCEQDSSLLLGAQIGQGFLKALLLLKTELGIQHSLLVLILPMETDSFSNACLHCRN